LENQLECLTSVDVGRDDGAIAVGLAEGVALGVLGGSWVAQGWVGFSDGLGAQPTLRGDLGGQDYGYGRSLPWGAGEVNVASMGVYDHFGDRQP
jgi:hypothetical protein